MALVVTYSDGNLLFTDTGTQTLTNSVSLSPNDIIENKANGDVVIVGNDNGEVKAKFNRYTELNPPLVAPALFTTKPLPLPVSVVSSTPNDTEVASATWGYDVAGTLFYVKQKSDGTIVYESPIGTVTAPVGDVMKFNTQGYQTIFNIIESSGVGLVPQCIRWNIENTGGAVGTIDGVNLSHQHESKGDECFTNPITGKFYYSDGCSYDASGTTFLITYTTD